MRLYRVDPGPKTGQSLAEGFGKYIMHSHIDTCLDTSLIRHSIDPIAWALTTSHRAACNWATQGKIGKGRNLSGDAPHLYEMGQQANEGDTRLD